MTENNNAPIVSTYVHVPNETRISHAIDSSIFGISASIRVGEYGENDAALFFRSPEQLDKLAEEASKAAKSMRQAIELQKKIRQE